MFTSLVSFFVYLVVCLVIYYLVFIYKFGRILKFSWNENFFFLPILPLFGASYVAVIASLAKGLPVNLMTTVHWMAQQVKHPFNFWIGIDYYYTTNNPFEMKIILNHVNCYNKGKIYKPLDYFFGTSLVLASTNKWKSRRKYIQTSYKPSVIKSFIPTFYDVSNKLVKKVQDLKKDDSIFYFFSHFSFTVFFLTSAGLKEESSFPELKTFGEIVIEVQKYTSFLLMYPIIPINFWTRFFSFGKQLSNITSKGKTIVGKLIEQKKGQTNKSQAFEEANKVIPFFDLLINEEPKKLTDNEIFDEIMFFTAAATETTGTALSFCFTLLGMYPEYQDIVYKEVMDQIGFRDISSADLLELHYTEAVIMETLRLFPPIPFVARHVDDDVDLGTKVIPKGANIILDIFHLQRDDKYWTDPLKFDPPRFFPENASKHIPYAFLAFSGGPKDCLGKGQAMTVMKLTVANVIRTYRMKSKYKSVDEIVLTSSLSLQTAEKLDCQFIIRLQE